MATMKLVRDLQFKDKTIHGVVLFVMYHQWVEHNGIAPNSSTSKYSVITWDGILPINKQSIASTEYDSGNVLVEVFER